MKDKKRLAECIEIPEIDELSKRLNEQEVLDIDCNWSNDPAEN